jgi:hypothetical protein
LEGGRGGGVAGRKRKGAVIVRDESKAVGWLVLVRVKILWCHAGTMEE